MTTSTTLTVSPQSHTFCEERGFHSSGDDVLLQTSLGNPDYGTFSISVELTVLSSLGDILGSTTLPGSFTVDDPFNHEVITVTVNSSDLITFLDG